MRLTRDRPPLTELLPAAPTLRAVLRELHSPMRGTLQASPAGKQWCRGCGGVIRWPCVTRRLLDGEPPTIAAELDHVGAPLHFDDQEATA